MKDPIEIFENIFKYTFDILKGINYKLILFLLLLPLYAPMYLFLHLTFKWWEGLLD